MLAVAARIVFLGSCEKEEKKRRGKEEKEVLVNLINKCLENPLEWLP